MEADGILPDDLRNLLRDAAVLKQSCITSTRDHRELEATNALLRREVERGREGEERGRETVGTLSQQLAALQATLADLVDVNQENTTLRSKVKDYETKICQLNINLEKERLSCHQLMEKSRQEFEDQSARNLSYSEAEACGLREELASTREVMGSRTAELQAKLRGLENSKNDEISHLTYDFQEKINKLQSALSATQAENRNVRDRLQLHTATYQKKIQELERRSALHPALRPTPPPARAPKLLPPLTFLPPEQQGVEEGADPQPGLVPAVKKRRKLFTHKNSAE